MSDFSQDIQNFQRYGTYVYSFDNVGNMTFDSSSIKFNQVYVAFPLSNIVYNPSKIQTLYDPNFIEFVPPTVVTEVTSSADLQQQLDIVQQQNDTLQTQLNSIIAESQVTSSAATQQAIKQVILELREALGQGRVESDFSTDFPYTPIIKPTR